MTTTGLRCLLDGDFMHNKGKLARDSMATLHNIAYKPEDWISKGDGCCSFSYFHVYGLFFLSFFFLPHTLKMMSGRHKPGRPTAVCELGRNVLLKNAPLLTNHLV